MAYYRIRRNKKGIITSVRITIHTDSGQVNTSYQPEYEDMTEEQILKKARIYGASLENQLFNGTQLTAGTSFNSAAEYYIALGTAFGNKPKTEEHYRDCLKRINDSEYGFGEMPIGRVTTGTINMFLMNLSASEDKHAQRMRCIASMEKFLKKHHVSAYAFARLAGLSEDTIHACLKGRNITLVSAEKICAVYHDKVSSMFEPVKKKPLSSNFKNRHISFIRAVFNLAVNEHVLMFNPCDPVRMFRVTSDSDTKALSMDEVQRLFSCLKDEENLEMVVFTLLLMFTGARKGEICGLKWEHVDLENDRVSFCRTLQYVKHKGVVEGPLKNDRSRTVAIPPEITNILKKWKVLQNRQRKYMGSRWNDEGYVFTGEKGGHLFPDSPVKWLYRFCDRHDLPHVHPHMFRHTHASILIACGADVATVSNRLGHASVATTTRVYLHAVEGQDKLASSLFTQNVLQGQKLEIRLR